MATIPSNRRNHSSSGRRSIRRKVLVKLSSLIQQGNFADCEAHRATCTLWNITFKSTLIPRVVSSCMGIHFVLLLLTIGSVLIWARSFGNILKKDIIGTRTSPHTRSQYSGISSQRLVKKNFMSCFKFDDFFFKKYIIS